MRCYHFGNMYLSSIQQGIQAAHAQAELFVKYYETTYCDFDGSQKQFISHFSKRKALYHWAANHKTIICLNAGMDTHMQELYRLLSSKENPYPWAPFFESTEAMGGMMTNIAVILHEDLYNTTDEHFTNHTPKELGLTKFDVELINFKNRCRLAI